MGRGAERQISQATHVSQCQEWVAAEPPRSPAAGFHLPWSKTKERPHAAGAPTHRDRIHAGALPVGVALLTAVGTPIHSIMR
jgi:hypothetical protein